MRNLLKQNVFYLLIFCFILFSCSRIIHRGVLGKKPNNRQVNKRGNPSANTNNKTATYNTGDFKGKLIKNVIYGAAENINNNSEQLSMDVYEPAMQKEKNFL